MHHIYNLCSSHQGNCVHHAVLPPTDGTLVSAVSGPCSVTTVWVASSGAGLRLLGSDAALFRHNSAKLLKVVDSRTPADWAADLTSEYAGELGRSGSLIELVSPAAPGRAPRNVDRIFFSCRSWAPSGSSPKASVADIRAKCVEKTGPSLVRCAVTTGATTYGTSPSRNKGLGSSVFTIFKTSGMLLAIRNAREWGSRELKMTLQAFQRVQLAFGHSGVRFRVLGHDPIKNLLHSGDVFPLGQFTRW
jgi:hypothetical protein